MSTREQRERKQAAVDALRAYRGTHPDPDPQEPTHPDPGHSGVTGRPFLTKSRKEIAADACRGIPPPGTTVARI